jgi:hypothetical protein
VHDQGPGQADVTEGSRGVWERLHYDWSDPNRIVMTTTDSNVWGGGSGHTYTLTRQPNGTTDVDVVVVREGKNLKGRLIAIAVSIIGKQFLGKELGKTIKGHRSPELRRVSLTRSTPDPGAGHAPTPAPVTTGNRSSRPARRPPA